MKRIVRTRIRVIRYCEEGGGEEDLAIPCLDIFTRATERLSATAAITGPVPF